MANLGCGTWSTLGRGVGAFEVLANGERANATIPTDDGQITSMGVCDLDTGWDALMPPQMGMYPNLDFLMGSSDAEVIS